jgi:hypothetical protein
MNPRQTIDRFRLCISVVTVLYLGLATQNLLSCLLTSEHRDFGRVAFEAAGNATGPDSHLQLDALITDGRHLNWDSINDRQGWKTIATGSVLPSLTSEQDSRPSVLNFRCKRFVAVLQVNGWSGTVRIKRNGSLEQLLDIQDSDRGTVVLADPPAPRSVPLLIGAVVFFGVLAWWLGPIYRTRNGSVWLLVFLSSAHLLYWAALPVATNGDSSGYYGSIAPIFASGAPCYFPPGYPALLGILDGFSGPSLGNWITLVQHAMSVLAAWWLYLLLRRIASEPIAFLGGVLAGILIPAFTISQSVLAEMPTCFAMVGTVYFAIRSRDTGRFSNALVAGLFLGWAGTLRVVPLAGAGPAVCAVLLWGAGKKYIRQLGVLAVAAIVVVASPLVWFGIRTGRPELATSSGLHLYNRVLSEQKMVNEAGPATRRLRALLAGKELRADHWIVREQSAVRELDYTEQEKLLHAVALEGISKDPLRYALYTLQLAWRDYLAPTGWIPTWYESTAANPNLDDSPPLPFSASGLTWRWTQEDLQVTIWPILCWLALAGALLGLTHPQRSIVAALACIPIGYLLASGAVEYFSPRYNAALVPFVPILAVLSLDRTLWTAFVRSSLRRFKDTEAVRVSA